MQKPQLMYSGTSSNHKLLGHPDQQSEQGLVNLFNNQMIQSKAQLGNGAPASQGQSSKGNAALAMNGQVPIELYASNGEPLGHIQLSNQ